MTIPDDALKMLEREIDPAFAERARFIAHRVWQEKPRRVLDLGCGRGYYLQLLQHAPFIENVVGLDINFGLLNQAKSYRRDEAAPVLAQGSALRLPFAAESFDCVVCSEVLEHLSDDARAMHEIERVLAPDGLLLISVPNQSFPFCWDPVNWALMRYFKTHLPKRIHWLAGIWADHERLYSAERLRQLVEKRFAIDYMGWVVKRCWPFSHHLLYGLGKPIVLGLNAERFNRFSAKSENKIAAGLAKAMKLPGNWHGSAPNQEHAGVNLILAAYKK